MTEEKPANLASPFLILLGILVFLAAFTSPYLIWTFIIWFISIILFVWALSIEIGDVKDRNEKHEQARAEAHG